MDEMKLQEIQTGLKTAYIDGSLAPNLEYKPKFVSNRPKEGKKVLSTIEEELRRCEHFQISVAFITMGGIAPLLMTLQELEAKGIKGEILTTNYLDFTQPEALEKLNSLSNITLRMFDVESAKVDFHSKGYIFKRDEVYRIILGSSNITGHALTSNVEWNTKIISTEQGEITKEILNEFYECWNSPYALKFDEFFEIYKERYNIIKKQRDTVAKEKFPSIERYRLKPNSMQEQFIVNLRKIIESGEDRALLISATGTGKTYASAFAMRELGFKRVLFLVHREQLAIQAKNTFQNVFGSSVNMGIVGAGKREYDSDYVFAMVETLNREQHLEKYTEDAFDCIILDEAHHSPNQTYIKVMNHFKPKLFLGMTATPDKRDDALEGRNVYELFNYQIAHEIRLQKAMEDDLLCPFHYFGISDISLSTDVSTVKKINAEDFNRLTSDSRVDHIISQAKYYGYSGNRVKGLIFCSRIDESKKLSEKLNARGLRTIALNGGDAQKVREQAFERLAMDEKDSTPECPPLDYIISVDILNEGIDIVEVNQVIMLRPTQSPIVFIQQLGRGLRKAEGKEYVVILDFIGNYENNFMIPIALSGDRTYNTDVIRKYVISGNSTLPGESTIHFDSVAKERIFKSIDGIKKGTIKGMIRQGYLNLKNRLGRIPRLFDFYENDEVDPLLIVREYKTYYQFIEVMEKGEVKFNFSQVEKLTLEYLSKTIMSGIRPSELTLLDMLMTGDHINYSDIEKVCRDKFDYSISLGEFDSAISTLEGHFVSKADEYEKYKCMAMFSAKNRSITRQLTYATRLLNKEFQAQMRDIISVGLGRYKDRYMNGKRIADCPFVLYEKYSRRDVSLLMDVRKDLSATMFGKYSTGEDVFIFVTYHKEAVVDSNDLYIAGRPDYADTFEDNVKFRWDSQIGSGMNSAYMQSVCNAKRKHLFVQKSNVENNFFYMGQFDIEGIRETQKENNRNKLQPICKVEFRMHNPVREDLLSYLTSSEVEEIK